MIPLSSEFDEQTQERAALHALGLLSPEENAEFEREMWSRPGLRELVQEMRVGLEQVARAEARHVPKPHMRETLLDQVSTRPASNPPLAFPAFVPEVEEPKAPLLRMPSNIVWLPWAAAAAFALLAGMFFFQRNAARDDARLAEVKASNSASQLNLEKLQSAGLGRRLTDLEGETSRLRAESAKAAQNQVTSWSRLRVASLGTTPSANPASKAAATVLWDPDQNAGMMNVRNLPPAPAGKDYQLWILDPTHATPISGGVFKTNADGSAQIPIKPSSAGRVKADKFAISLEVEGGRPSPEGMIFLSGN
jgi:anti-sigma-K factor RskA